MVRADLFLQVAEGLLKLNEPVWGKFYLDQAFVVATRSPYLQAVHRRAILERLQKHYISLGERELARKSLDLSVNAPDITSPNEEKVYMPPRAALPLPQLIQTVEITRWLKAQELEAQLVERGGHAPPSKIKALQEALVAEDQQKLPFYASELSSAAQVSKKIDITLAKIEWLSIKYRVARQGYGLSLVPDWERQADMIRADLTKTYETLYSLYADFIVALPEAGQLDQATAEKLRREVLAGELGRYPNYPQEQRRKQLLEITQQLMTEQPELNIFVGTQTVAGQETYTLQTVK
jgi:hypothetical protein